MYFSNHNYWWDGLIPLFLARKYFKQDVRAIMDLTQMKKHRFFSRIGAFSVDLKNSKSTIVTLRYALECLKKENRCLYIYPEGKITAVTEKNEAFQKGLAWIYQHSTSIDFVPIGINIDFTTGNKPNLYIYIGESVKTSKSMNRSELTNYFKDAADKVLTASRHLPSELIQ